MHDSLFPIRHPNTDFCIADIFDAIPVKCDRHTMEYHAMCNFPFVSP